MNVIVMVPECCPVCGSDLVVRLPADWQARVESGHAIPIAGCGNPWHYANLPLSGERGSILHDIASLPASRAFDPDVR